MKYQQGMIPFVDKIYQSLSSIINNPQVPTSVGENAVIALGRLGVDCSQQLAPHLAEFANPFLHIIEPVEHNDEKGHAFLGLNRTIEHNPQAMEGCLLEYFKASAAYNKNETSSFHQKETVGSSFQRVSQDFTASRTIHTYVANYRILQDTNISFQILTRSSPSFLHRISKY